MHNFSFGSNNLLHFGGRILQAPSHTVAKRNIEFIKIYGQSGDEIIDNESYDNVDFSIKIGFLPLVARQTAHNLAYAVIDWLAPLQNNYYEYRDTYNPGCFTNAVLTNFEEIKRELPTLLTTTLKFNRVPFWYLDSGTQEITFSNQGLVVNPEIYSSEPILKLTYSGSGSANVQIEFNGVPIAISMDVSPRDIQYIDGVSKQHYRIKNGEKIYLSDVLPPDLTPGDNVITFSTSSVVCALTPNWRRL